MERSAPNLDLGDMALPDLLNGINDDFAHNIQAAAPDAYAALLHFNPAVVALADPSILPAQPDSALALPAQPAVQVPDAMLDPQVGLPAHTRPSASAPIPLDTTPPTNVDPSWVPQHPIPVVHAPLNGMHATAAVGSTSATPVNTSAALTVPSVDSPMMQASPMAPNGTAPLAQQLAAQQGLVRQQGMVRQQELVRQRELAESQQLAQRRQLAQQQQQIVQQQHIQHQMAQQQIAQQQMVQRRQMMAAQPQQTEKTKVGGKRGSAQISKDARPTAPMVDVAASRAESTPTTPPHVKYAQQLFAEPKQEQRSQDGLNGPGSSLDAEEDQDQRKAMRAERNRQSAAASRERRKHHIKELERRVALLTKENATLQVGELNMLKEKIEQERELLKENQLLKRDVHLKNMEIMGLSEKLAGLNPFTKKRASTTHHKTLDESSWPRRRSASGSVSTSSGTTDASLSFRSGAPGQP